MNVLEQIKVKQSPFEFFYEPRPIVMSQREISILPALVSELVGMSIVNVSPAEGVGRVIVFDVSPLKKPDPPLVFCKCVDLTEYYRLWRVVVEKSYLYAYNTVNLVSEYTDMMRSINVSELKPDEAAFLFVELLKFKNEYVRPAQP